jgi:rRNA pseudouridine-1189 N-methylase Emg1 (Nep1/Mra1 family)
MYQLLNSGHVPDAPPYLITKISDDFPGFLKILSKELKTKVITFSTNGEPVKLRPFIKSTLETEEDVLFIIGGFQKGNIDEIYTKNSEKVVAVYNKGLESWTIIARLISSIEDHLEII